MVQSIRTRYLAAAFMVSLGGLGLTAGAQKLAQVSGTAPVIIDDGDPGYVGTNMTGPVGYKTGYNGDTAYFTPQKKVTGANSRATWTFTNLTPGSYDVYATWGEYSKATTSTEYSITENGQIKIVDQTRRPPTVIDGRAWQPIGTTDVGQAGKVTVTLKIATIGTTLADAVMVMKKETSNPNGGGNGGSMPVDMNTCLNNAAFYWNQETNSCIADYLACSESDNGDVPTVVGHTFGFRANAEGGERDERIRTGGRDSCVDAQNVLEHFCSNGYYIESKTVNCPGGCQDGACKAITAPVAACGNATIEGNEECDDGNRKPGDGCNSACRKEVCGDGIVTAGLGEECDTKTNPMNKEQPYEGCSATCKMTYCGDGVIQQELKEQCDDGNGMNGDGCNTLCQTEATIFCGKTLPEGGSQCEPMTEIGCSQWGGKSFPTNQACFEGLKPVACRVPPSTGSAMQNQAQPHDVDGNGVVNDFDTEAVTFAINAINDGRAVPAGYKADVDGNGTIGISDITQLIYYVNCMKPKVACTDTDGGNMPNTKGRATSPTQAEEDTCINTTKLKERVCESNAVITKEVTCPTGTSCSDGACKQTTAGQCAPIALKGKPMQNQTKPADVNNDGKVDFWDVRAIYGYYNEEPIGGKIATKVYMNVDGSTDFFGRETFDIQDILYVVNNVNFCNLPTEKTLTLTSVTMGCEANVNVAKVTYEKNFEGCAHVVDAAGKRLDGQNYLCPNAGPISIPLAKLAISTNQSVKICDATDYTKCSQPVSVTGSPCGALPPSITLGNAVISCNAENKTIFTVNYQANNVNSTFLHLVDEQQTLRHTTNLFLSDQVKTSAPISSFIDIAPGLKLKLCTTNYGTCSSLIAVTGKACGAAPTTEILSVAVKNIGTTDTAVKNEKNVTLFRFEARGNDQYPTIKKIVMKAAEGSASNASNYSLWADLNGDGQVETMHKSGVSAQNGLITFENLDRGGIGLQMNAANLIEIHGDIASSLVDGTLRLSFAENTPGYIAASLPDGTNLAGIKTNGVCAAAPCAIGVSTVASKKYILSNQGDLFVTLDSTPTRSRQILGGTLSDTVLRIQFRGQNEDVDVTDLQFTSRGSDASSIDRLELYKDGATTPFATATVSGCESDQVNRTDRGVTVSVFCANMENGQLIAKDGENLDVLIKARMKSDDPSPGAISGQGIQLFLSSRAVSNNATGEGAVRARGKTSSNNLLANDGDAANEGEVFIGTDAPAANTEIAGNMNTAVLSKIVSITNANPDEDNISVPTGIWPIGQFKFTAATNWNTLNGLNKATLNTITFTVNATNVSLDASSFKFWNKADSSNKATCTATSGGGTPGNTVTNVTCSNVHLPQSASGGLAIDASLESGENSTFVLEVNVTNPKVVPTTNSALQVSLQNFSTPYPASSNILWSDTDVQNSMQFKWIEYSETVVRSTSYKS